MGHLDDTDPDRADAEEGRRLRRFFDAMEDAFCIVEVVPGADGQLADLRYTDVNPAFEGQTGMADVEGRTASEVFPGLEPHWFAHFETVWATGEPTRFVERAESLGRWYEVSLSRLGERAERRLTCLFRDVSELKSNEERLHELASELSESDRRKTEFLATLAHELRNPLAPIRSGVELVAERAARPTEVRDISAMMGRQVDQLVHLVDDLLDISRISQDKIVLQRRPVTLGDVVHGAVEASRALIEMQGHTLELDLPDRPVRMDLDPVRITQTLANLLSNAARYTPKGGSVRVSARASGDEAVLSVADDGEGLAPDEIERVFEMFTQVSGTAPREHGGLGIGLTLSRRLVELHGGTLRAYSEGPGRGSRFEIRLPFVTASEIDAATSAGPRTVPSRREARVLVVDDNVDAAAALVRILALRGYAASAVHTGRAALVAVDADPPDVLLLDIGLPDITGYQVAVELGKRADRAAMTIVALTGWGTESDRARAADAGFEHHLTKPVSSVRVLDLLDSLEAVR